MSKNSLFWDLRAVARGVEAIINATIQVNQRNHYEKWRNSSVKELIKDVNDNILGTLKNIKPDNVTKSAQEGLERATMVYYGLRELAKAQSGVNFKEVITSTSEKTSASNFEEPNNFSKFPIHQTKGVTAEDLQISELAERDKELIKRLELEHEKKLQREKLASDLPLEKEKPPTPPKKKEIAFKQELNPESRQRKVPATRLSRLLSFGSLAAGLGIGTVAEITRRTFQPLKNEETSLDRIFLTEANAERIVATLCKVRGAALKIGQILSIQDNTIISPGLQKAFERVRQSADFMPTWQVEKMLVKELGPDWRSKIENFEEKPFAAASIGQVHLVKLRTGKYAAMKIQYPGVAQGINSDIDNLVSVLNVWNIFPKGLFIENLVEVAKRELAWEVDYIREKECTKKFKELLKPYPDFVVPEVVDELSTRYVITTELLDGIPVDKCIDLDESTRNRIARLIMKLCLLELFELRYMQTDPNWSNFFYNNETQKLALLDFGASRAYSKEFMDKYIEVIKGAVDKDREKVLQLSREIGLLTGYESKLMEATHVDAVMILGEVFSSEKPFDFGQQNTTRRIQQLVPTIIAERLCPPPEEIYSLHRKLSGVFLLCAKLRVKISCRDLFLDVYNKYR